MGKPCSARAGGKTINKGGDCVIASLRLSREAGIGLLAVLLTACAGTPPPSPAPPANAGRYEMEHDSPLLEPFDQALVKPVIPVAEPRTLAGNRSPYTVNGVSYRVMESEAGYTATGTASWYGRKFHGHRTSNGEIYDMFQLSAAHRSLPIPSYARVTNLENGRSVVVRVNDRGPFHSERIMDLSYAAATLLGYAAQGTARVRIEAIVPGQPQQPTVLAATSESRAAPPQASVQTAPIAEGDSASGGGEVPAPLPGEYLQVAAFSSLESARGLLARLAGLTSLPAFIRSEPGGSGMLHRVRVGPLNESVDLDGLIQAIVDARLGTPFKVRQ